MDALLRLSQEKLKQHPDNEVAQRLLQRLSSAAGFTNASKGALREDVEALLKEGVLDAADVSLIDKLKLGLSGSPSPATGSPRPSHDDTVQTNGQARGDGQTQQQPNGYHLNASNDTPSRTHAVVPLELVDSFNQTQFMHTLATNPSKVLPPGKSLISVLSRPREESEGNKSGLEKQVATLVHAAFWDEMYESLSNVIPSVQLARIKGLYEDLYNALSPLLPPDHDVLITLTSPMPPTSSPLHSTLIHLREALRSLRERCAPARDSTIDELLQRLDHTPSSDLARIIVDVVKATLSLASDMKDDLSTFVMSNMGEEQLQDLVVAQAATFERELVLGTSRPERVEERWRSWLEGGQGTSASPGEHQRFVARLMQALGTNAAVSCPLPPDLIGVAADQPSSPNSLPPPLFFVLQSLLRVQNYIQALVIAASLRALVPLPPSHASSGAGEELTQRVWTLLESEIEEEGTGADDTKIVNLADEVVRIRRAAGGTSASGEEEERKLRAAVDRTLKAEDPVFQLLQRRLVRALTARLSSVERSTDGQSHPMHMRAGRALGLGKTQKRPAMRIEVWKNKTRKPLLSGPGDQDRGPLVVKGFEGPTLADAINGVVDAVRRDVEWTELVWSDLFEQGTLDVEMSLLA